MKWLYHASRVVFGGWWLFSGLMHFLWPEFQPSGPGPRVRNGLDRVQEPAG